MPQPRHTLMNPPIEDLLDKVDSKFTLVALSAKRARQINSYYNQLGEGLGMVVPPQVASVSGKPLTIAFEEVAAGKATYHRIDPDELAAVAAVAEVEGGAAAVDILAVDTSVRSESEAADILAVTTVGQSDSAPVESAPVDSAPVESAPDEIVSEAIVAELPADE
jgi:DNA-directed RNA polymerase subunit omega